MNKRTYIIISLCVCALILIITIPCVLLINKEFCQLNFNEDFTETHPLILQLNDNKFIATQPTGTGINIPKGETFRLVCSGNSNKFQIYDVKEILATCVTNKIFTTNILKLGEINFIDLNCTQTPKSIAKRVQTAKCLTDKTEINIGFETFNGFVSLYKTCFDETKKDSLYSTFTLSNKVSRNNSYTRSKIFEDGDFYKDIIPDVDTLYLKTNQKKLFDTILGENNTYFDTKKKFYSRGHLTANADFTYYPQKKATFYYVNVAPQWDNFNGGNWKILEENVRDYALKQFQDLIVYTGVYGQAKLPDENNTIKELYLHSNGDKTYLKVPEIFWKLIYNPYYQTATVFVGHNNIYEAKLEKVCTDICDKINWLTWDSKNITAGLTYCCDYYEFQTNVHLLPDLLVFGYLI